jgi:hypothetical protein
MQQKKEDTTITAPVPDHAELRIGTPSGVIWQSGLPRSLFEAG